MPKRSRDKYGTPITAATLPQPVWGPRDWTDNSARDGARPLEQRIWQALYPLRTAYGLNIGVRITVAVSRYTPELNSYATAEVFDGTQWTAVAGLPAKLMRVVRLNQRYLEMSEGEEDNFLGDDVARLLEDVRLAHALRSPGPDEIAERDRVVVTHDPSAEPFLMAFAEPVTPGHGRD